MMHYERYFKPGQRLMLRRVGAPGAAAAALDSLAVQLVSCSEAGFVVRLPDVTVFDDIAPDAVYEILGDLFDFGLRLTARFDRPVPGGQVLLLPNGDLEFFFRRKHLRAESQLWLGYRRGGSLRTLRRQWQDWSAAPSLTPAATLPPFSLQSLSLSGGGLGLSVPAPVKKGDCFLVFLALDDNQPLVVAVAEVVWVGPAGADGLQNSGLRFLNLLDRDRQRIERYVRRQLLARKAGDEGS